MVSESIRVYLEGLDGSKLVAGEQVQMGLSRLERQLAAYVRNIRETDHEFSLEIDEIVENVIAARQAWLDYVEAVFDAEILKFKNNLQSLAESES